MTAPSPSFYYAEGETPQGPFSAAHILSLKSLGKITDETYVIQAGGTEWTTFAVLQPTLKNLLPGPARPVEAPSPAQAASPMTAVEDKGGLLAKAEPSSVEFETPGPNASFTEHMLALAKSLDTPEQRHKRLASGLGSTYELEENVAIKVVKNALANGYRGSLDLSQLSSISQELADLLAQYPTTGKKECKIINGVSQEYGEDETLELTGLDELTPEIAKSLGRHKGWLVLGGFQELSRESAEGIAVHEGRLGLGLLEEISEEAAAALSKHRYTLNLSGIKDLKPEIASLLSKRSPIDNDVSLLLDLFEVSLETAQALGAGTEKIELGEMETISDEALTALGSRKGPVHFDGFTYLSPRAMEILKSGKYPQLKVLGLEDIEVRE
jgi:hypothetical protein